VFFVCDILCIMKRNIFFIFFVGFFVMSDVFILYTHHSSAQSCSADTWQCGDWKICQRNGTQLRTCTKTFDCPSAETPSPSTSQSCGDVLLPPPPPQPGNSPPPPSPTPRTDEEPPPDFSPVTCFRDVFDCDEWRSCDRFGEQQRDCSLSFDCPNVVDPKPFTSRRCENLQCGNKEFIDERIQCRLELEPAGLVRELELQYFPEECRSFSDEKQRDECVELYRSADTCYNFSRAEDRFNCLRSLLSAPRDFRSAYADCGKRFAEARIICEDDLKQAVFTLVKFRFEDMSKRAQNLLPLGVSVLDVTEFVSTVELKKQEFNDAETKFDRREIVLDVRRAWRDFVQKAINQLR